jgi:hypothetical protein
MKIKTNPLQPYVKLDDLVISFRLIWCSCSQTSKLFGFLNILTLSVPDEGYPGNTSCTLNKIPTLLFVTAIYIIRLIFYPTGH